MLDCARQGSLGKLDKALMEKAFFPTFWKHLEVRILQKSVQCARWRLVFPLSCREPVLSRRVRACEESVANDPAMWILKRGNG